MKAVTVAEMRALEQAAIERIGIPGLILMENAGTAVARLIIRLYGPVKDKKICVFAGKGNNGGDGFVTARHLHNAGAKVKVFLLAPRVAVGGDARVNLEALVNMGVDVVEVNGERDRDKIRFVLAFTDIIVDAIFGTGFSGRVQGLAAEVITLVNTAEKPVVAVDLPSGVNADTGAAEDPCIRASATVTFGLPKVGLLLYPAVEYTGQLFVADISLPVELVTQPDLRHNLTMGSEVRALLPRRRGDAHKGHAGRVLVIAGSPGLTGAAALASQAAVRSGAGLVTLGIARSLHDIMEMKLTEVMTRPLPDNGGILTLKARGVIEELAAGMDAVAVGPGLSTGGETVELVRQLVQCIQCPLVLDADALNALAEEPEVLAKAAAPLVLTPHPGEMARLLSLPVKEIQANRIAVARTTAQRWGATVVLKGARTVVAEPGGEIWINPTGTTAMATGGTGDVLTGMITALIGQGIAPLAAAIAGVYLHGLAGEMAAATIGEVGIAAGDLLERIPQALRRIREEQEDNHAVIHCGGF